MKHLYNSLLQLLFPDRYEEKCLEDLTKNPEDLKRLHAAISKCQVTGKPTKTVLNSEEYTISI